MCLRGTVTRSREVIDEARIEKINLTTGPMAITGSTRMQATTIQLCVMTTVLEMVVRELVDEFNPAAGAAGHCPVPQTFLAKLKQMHQTLMLNGFAGCAGKDRDDGRIGLSRRPQK